MLKLGFNNKITRPKYTKYFGLPNEKKQKADQMVGVWPSKTNKHFGTPGLSYINGLNT